MRWRNFIRNFYIGRAQRVAAALLLVMLLQCLWLVNREPLASQDYRFASCGRQMWEQPSPIQGYFTTCGNLNGDGTFGYRLAGLPLSLQRWAMLAVDHFRKPEDRLYGGLASGGTLWEERHQLLGVKYLLRVPFVMFALWLGGGLWWVARRLYGNEGGAIALSLYVFCPAVLRFAVQPNNEILALWGLYGMVYTAIGVAHAMQGPRKKWRPRILLLTFALGMTAAAHLLAAMVGFVAGSVFLFYLAERRRSHVSQVLIFAATGALAILFASYTFRVSAFLYVFTGGSARFWFTLANVRALAVQSAKIAVLHGAVMPVELPIVVATLLALALYASNRRSRYFGNTSALLMVLVLAGLYTTQVFSAPWLWALPFLLTFVSGVFADALESRHRRAALVASATIMTAQALLCWGWMLAQ